MPPAGLNGGCGVSTARTCVRTRPRPARRREKNLPTNEPADHALGRSRGGWGSKIHLLTDGHGLPLAVEISAGQAHESRFFEPVLDAVRIEQPRGPARRRPQRLAGDRGYSFPRIRAWLRAHRIRAVIPERRDQIRQHRGPPCVLDVECYRQRNVVERCIGVLKEARRLATRYEKLAVHYLGVIKLAMVMQLLQAALSNTP
jgi:transposase